MFANDLVLFSQIVELGSFKKAAELNNITNSVVSKRITQLEKALNAQLLYRTTRSLALTEAGKKLASSADIIKHVTQEAIDDIKDDNDMVSGHINMSVPTISGDLLLGEAVAEFCHLHPNVSVNMSLDNRFVNPLEEGYDLVIRTGLLEDSSLIARHIINSQWVICCSPFYISRYGKPAEPTELTQHNCMIYLYQAAGASNWAFSNEQEQYTVKIHGTFASDNASALRKAALAGHGIAHVPKCLVHEDILAGDLVTLLNDKVDKTIGVYALHPFIKKTPRKVTTLVEHIKNAYLAKGEYFE